MDIQISRIVDAVMPVIMCNDYLETYIPHEIETLQGIEDFETKTFAEGTLKKLGEFLVLFILFLQ